MAKKERKTRPHARERAEYGKSCRSFFYRTECFSAPPRGSVPACGCATFRAPTGGYMCMPPFTRRTSPVI